MLLAHVLCRVARRSSRRKSRGSGCYGNSASTNPARIEAFRQGLRELGYVEGKNIVIEWRFCGGKTRSAARTRCRAGRVSRSTSSSRLGTGDIRAAKEATATIPIVMISGWRSCRKRPCRQPSATRAGTLPDWQRFAPELSGKRLELLKETVPRLSRVAVFAQSRQRGSRANIEESSNLAAGPLGVQLQYLDIRSPKDFESAFRDAAKGRAEAVLVRVPGPILIAHRTKVARTRGKRAGSR